MEFIPLLVQWAMCTSLPWYIMLCVVRWLNCVILQVLQDASSKWASAKRTQNEHESILRQLFNSPEQKMNRIFINSFFLMFSQRLFLRYQKWRSNHTFSENNTNGPIMYRCAVGKENSISSFSKDMDWGFSFYFFFKNKKRANPISHFNSLVLK